MYGAPVVRLTGILLCPVITFLFLIRPLPAEDAAAKNPAATEQNDVYFARDVVPALTKLGCNSGGCHGKSTGQNGFKLSLLGYGPTEDYEAIVVEARGRRLFPADPSQSLLLRKATGETPHGGGQRVEVDSDDYRVLLDWISAGAPAPKPEDPFVDKVSVTPDQSVLSTSDHLQLQVTAHFSDGNSRDVTRQAVYESNEPDVAEVDDMGVLSTSDGGGLFAVMVRYGEKFAVFHGTVPFAPDEQKHSSITFDLKERLERDPVDRHLLAAWNRLGIEPSPPADDATFVRRVTLDICGRLPRTEEVQAYLDDPHPDKQARLIDRLLDDPGYASYFALKWADILQNRGRGYSTSKQRQGTALFAAWIRDAIADNLPYDRFVAEILTATGSQETNPPTVWYRTVRTEQEYVESVSQAFLGVRLQCAQCHHHPTEQLSQDDYYGLAAVFSRVGRKGGFADAEVPTNEVIFLKPSGETIQPRTGEVMSPRPLGGPDFSNSSYSDPRHEFVHWMIAPDNPYFAQTMANRIWAHFLGRGIIHPIDDARSTNPPSNPALLEALTQEFVASGYDVKHLIRICANSYAYHLSMVPTASNAEDRQCFARFSPRRLPAEVLLDAFSDTLGVPTKFPGSGGEFLTGTRAIDLPDEAVDSNFLDVFGRPARSSACECERVDAPALGQALELVSSPLIQEKLASPDGFAAELAAGSKSHAENVHSAFLRIFSRPPRPEEVAVAVDFLEGQEDASTAYQSLLWSLLATNEFLFNH
ncbi:MAG: DUF1549 domain-containing protein [Planctomycetaceae bacterium]|nr:DUF1549 domain-containing protein [Planctomycetaceae bacterium]